MKRTIEMAICYSDGTWQAEYFVEVEDPGECCDGQGCCGAQDESERLELLGREALQKQLDNAWKTSLRPSDAPEIVAMWLYHYGEEEDEDETPQRSQVACELSFDMGKVTEGSEKEQQAAAVELVNLALQRQPYGLGANIKKSP